MWVCVCVCVYRAGMLVAATRLATIIFVLKPELAKCIALQQRTLALTRCATAVVAHVSELAGDRALDGWTVWQRSGARRHHTDAARALAIHLRQKVVLVRVAVEHERFARQRLLAEEPAHLARPRRHVAAADDVTGAERKQAGVGHAQRLRNARFCDANYVLLDAAGSGVAVDLLKNIKFR